MRRALARITCLAATLLAVTAAGAAEQPDEGPGGPDGPGGPEGPGGFGGPGGEPGYGIAWYPSASVSEQGTKLGIVRNRVGVELPVWSKDADAVMASLSVDDSHFSGEALLPDTRRAFPSDLWNIQGGLKHMHQFSSGSSSVLMFDIGSATDKPFNSWRDMSYTVGGFYRKPVKNGRDAWNLGAIYSPLGPFGFPIPIVSYNWNPSERFHLNIGIPFSMNWQPTDKLDLDMSLNPGGVDALATYKLSDRLSAYGGYQDVSDQYFLSGRVEKKDQFFAIEQRFIAGLRRDLGNGLSLDVNAGYAFDRHYGEGDDQQDLRDRVNLESSAFLGARLIWGF
jgi:hypothetical protein